MISGKIILYPQSRISYYKGLYQCVNLLFFLLLISEEVFSALFLSLVNFCLL